jgi:hypothetical protein
MQHDIANLKRKKYDFNVKETLYISFKNLNLLVKCIYETGLYQSSQHFLVMGMEVIFEKLQSTT